MILQKLINLAIKTHYFTETHKNINENIEVVQLEI